MAISLQDLVAGDLVSAARRRLIDAFVADDLVNAGLGADQWWLAPGGLIGKDGQDGAPAGVYSEGWVFPGLDADGRPLRPVEGSNKVSVTIMERDQWGSNAHNTMVMPVLRILIFADTVRDPNGNTAGRFADLRCRKVAGFIDKVFHDAANKNHWWNVGKSEEMYVVACYRTPGGGLNVTDIPDNDYAVRGDLRYEVSLANWG